MHINDINELPQPSDPFPSTLQTNLRTHARFPSPAPRSASEQPSYLAAGRSRGTTGVTEGHPIRQQLRHAYR